MNEHRSLQSLIPWYVNGTLDESDQNRLNRHLDDCASCRAQVRREIEFARAVCEKPAALARAGGPGARAALLARVASDRSERPWRVHIRAIAAASIIAISLLFVGSFDTQPAYRTLTTPLPGDRAIVQILFEPSTSEEKVRNALDQFTGAHVLDQPAGGLYRLVVDEVPRAERIAERARELPGVRWVGIER